MRRLLSKLFVLLYLLPLFAENQQILIPKEVFVGDTATIQYKFESNLDFFAFVPDSYFSGEELFLDVEELSNISSSCTIKKATLTRDYTQYTLNITVVPWVCGQMSFKSFNIYDMYPHTNYAPEKQSYIIQLLPVTIASLSQKMGVTTLREQKGPILLPGTNYIILALSILLVLFITLIFIILIKLPKIIKFISSLKQRFEFYMNAKNALHKLKILRNAKTSDYNFSIFWQKTIKNYLNNRFSTNLTSTPSGKIYSEILKNTDGIIDENYTASLEELSRFFIRTDYIKFAHGSLDSHLLPQEEHAAAFQKTERATIITRSILSINKLEEM